MRRTLAAAGIAVLALTATGCGKQDDDAKATKSLTNSLMSSQQAGSSSQFFSLNRADANCTAQGLVDKIGTDQLQKYGLLDKNLDARKNADITMSAADAKAATDVFFNCVDVTSKVKQVIAKSGQIPQQFESCVNKTLTDKNLRPVFTKVFEGKQQEAQKQLVKPMLTCAQGSGG
jgi:hypothetical protein